jgi:succinate dehydrogenase / fumarate reductase cytochrome b subunit
VRQRFMAPDLPMHPGMAFAKVQHELSNPFMLAVYIVAMFAICWHFAYGIWLFAAKWGITPGPEARKRLGYVCAAFGIVLLAMGLASIWAFISPRYANAPGNVPLTGHSIAPIHSSAPALAPAHAQLPPLQIRKGAFS